MCCSYLILCLCFNLLWRKNANAMNRGRPIPETDGAWPIIGHLHLLQPPTLPHRLYSSLSEKYGPIFTLQIGLRKTLVINSWELAKDCFTTHDRVFASPPRTISAEILGYDYAMFGPHPYGPYWREMRKLAILELLSNRRLEQQKHDRVMEISTSMKELYQLWEAKSKDVKERVMVVVDIQKWFADLTLNITVKMVAGKRYFGASSKEDKLEARQMHKAIRDFTYLFGVFVVSDAIPFLGWLDYHGHVKDMKRNAKEVGCILDRWLEEHKQKKTTTTEDFMDVLLSVLQDKELFGRDADTVNKATCMNMILGADTNMVALTWALSLLLNNHHILKKAQEEIDIHVGKDQQIEESDIEKLVYLQAIVKETLRLYPPAPGPRESTEDCTVSGFHIPKGTHLITNTWQIHRDPRIWSNPCEFQPERFLTTQANLDFRGHDFEYIPFLAGRRSCPAISFAVLVVHLTLARLLQRFDFATPMDAPVEMNESVGLTNLKATPLEVLVTPRLPLHLY